MRININNIIIPLDKNQDREILKELEKKGIKKDNIEMLRWNKRSIDSRKKNDIKFIYNIEVLLKKEIDISALTNVLPVKEKEKVGWKFADCEMRGIPLRVEIGPKDMENNQAVLVRRDTHEKTVVSLDELEAKAAELLDTIQHDMLEKARKHRDAHTYTALGWDEFVETINTKPGFVKAMWCGCQECEDKIKEVTGATSRCMPFEQETLSDKCVCCGKPAKKMVYWGRAY